MRLRLRMDGISTLAQLQLESYDVRNSFLGAIRTKTSLSTSVRETAICRVAVLNKAWYEWESHSPILKSGEGETLPLT